jgi:putative PIG3 family NAD(P)H quinone oxidoreductase
VRAIAITKFGGPEVLALVDRPTPRPGAGEIRVRVRAAGVNRADIVQRRGGYPAPEGAPADIPGLEFAGEVEALGEGATEWQIGDRVFGLVGGGAYAEELVTHQRLVARIPEELSFVDAAAVPEAFITAYDALSSQAELSMGETVLIHAAGSGVGTAAVQLARACGARPIGTSRTPEKLERARELGLDEAIVVTEGSFADDVMKLTYGLGVDVVLELVGGDYLRQDLACTARRGRIVLVGLLAGRVAELDLATLLSRRLLLRGTALRSRDLEEKMVVTQTFARHLLPLLAARRLRAVVDEVLPLSQAAVAHVRLEKSGVFGKVVLDCS